MTVLETILNNKRREVASLKEKISIRDLEKTRLFSEKTLSLSDYLSDSSKTGIIAEFKRCSPSKGMINPSVNIEDVTRGYSIAGASGLSVLTDMEFFGGSCNDLTVTRELNDIPVLRKDFIIDEFQLLESRSAGADAILLIASALDRDQIRDLARLSHSLDMEVLLEVHSPDEIEKVNEYVNIIGVNNRDLRTFKIDTGTSFEMIEKVPHSFLKISESGLTSPGIIKELREAGYDGFLIGSLFMSAGDPVSAFVDFVREIQNGC